MKSGEILIFDGAFGTYYSSKNSREYACEYANIYDNERVIAIHKEYINDGALAIKTNTFGANSLLNPDFSVIKNIIKEGFTAAVSASKDKNVRIFADIGYISGSEDYRDEYIKLSEEFLKLGAENFLFETLDDFSSVIPALEHIKSRKPNAFIIVSFAVSQDGYTKNGLFYKSLISSAIKNLNVSLAGLNCVCGPSHLLSLISKLDVDYSKLCVMPNSGYPERKNGRTVFYNNSSYFSEKLLEIASFGVKAVGGCCGTTPEHIKKVSELLKNNYFPYKKPAKGLEDTKEKNRKDSEFKEKLASGKKIIAVEIDPPSNCDISFLIEGANLAKASGCDIVTIADSPLARTRADSLMTSVYVKNKAGVDVIPHLSCRDRNHIGIKASLIGANLNSIDNILAITGDPVHITERSEYKGVFSYNSFSLISLINSLNDEIFNERPFTICAALNINSANFGGELKRAQKKVENGVFALFTQPVFSKESIENLKLAKKTLNCKIIGGILPIVSYKNALFLNNEVSGISIPDEIQESFHLKTSEEAKSISVKTSEMLINEIYDYCDGFYLMTPLKRIDIICKLIKKIKEKDNKK